ncbi:bifunctional glutamate N-acetyltransferase/amino-acid acetyltransferase ArgJ [Silvibacterium dinghuense]|uniref:Arginine biosynthesis bifunctional protein ArgJ n=1 Tax=Silvibacterium dinghuense TaxID=1560006 RepID=A0A4Q1SGG9_9BACT|nr:bifunctional glutamate N-acetyltransferase/amino-acid acetyltransferase ArgJ [Silvibacterium dinghuense]RXS96459.1 bifunctional glutamate N-acetyltransferase/amino-acid acetyltransferase ArgJ [Silvibacterium dinghuense]GGG90937.1 arginine biosynthesis bifunctional protein ArgJ [Silvibacterium dinghuense]
MIQTSLVPAGALPGGFRFSAVTAGLKPSGKPDFAVAVADEAASAAAMFTGNKVKAAPLQVGSKHLEHSGGKIRVVAVNAGNANCATGKAGLRAAEAVCTAAAKTFGTTENEVFPSSTGIIGVPLPYEKLIATLPEVERTLAATPEAFSSFATAILTTDTRPKVAQATIHVDGREVRILGAAKGAGMIHPQLVPHATMLVYLFTDAAVAPAALKALLEGSVELSFNRISIDGDTSTNDTVLLLASSVSGASVDEHHEGFRSALREICTSLAKQIVDDGEGVTHVVELQINGGASDADALRVAKAIAHSPLNKTAWAGSDPNWGRLMAAAGYSGAELDPARINIWLGEQKICENGGRVADFDKSRAHQYLTQRNVTIRLDLGLGSGSCVFWTTDLTTEYVHINADYST